METLKLIVFIFLLVDAVAVNLIIWFGEKWYLENLKIMTRYLPPAKGWAALYLVMVAWIGFLTLI